MTDSANALPDKPEITETIKCEKRMDGYCKDRDIKRVQFRVIGQKPKFVPGAVEFDEVTWLVCGACRKQLRGYKIIEAIESK